MHPLLDEEFNSLSMEEIQNKINELNKRLLFYYNNPGIANQIRNMLGTLQMIASEKMRTEIEKAEKERQAKLEKARKELDS